LPGCTAAKAITRRAQWSSTNRLSAYPRLHESLRAVLSERLGWSGLREVQEQAYEAIRSGSDTLVIAPTAGGKSEAALIPVIDDLVKSGAPGVACLCISPLKALINDQEERLAAFSRPLGLSLAVWHGDVPRAGRGWDPADPPQFLLITPESLEVLLHTPDRLAALRSLRYVIVDELHAFVESERGVHLRVLLDRLDRIAAAPVQRIGLSATVGNPEEVLAWLSGGRGTARLVSVPPPPAKKAFRFVIEPDPDRQIDALARLVAGKKALVFVNSRTATEAIVQAAAGRIANLHIHHSSVAPQKRKEAEEAFHGPEGACIICTSTLELGLDIGDLDIVVQVGPPDSVSSFLQRMGRTGRREKVASVAWLLSGPGELLASCATIECAREKRTEPLHPPEKPWNVLVQQIFLYILSASRAGRGAVVRDLRSYYAFAGFSAAEIEGLLSHLVAAGYLSADGGMLMPGPEAERVFGRSRFRELYSVIAGGGEYRAVTPDGDVVGSLDARFAHQEDPGGFVLGGSAWSVVKCDESHRLVVVVPGAQAKMSSRIFRSAGSDAGLSPVICGGIRQILARGRSTLPLGDAEASVLREALGVFPDDISEEGIFVREERPARGREVVVYSFAGSRNNQVLASLLRGVLGRVRVRYDDFRVRISGAGKTGAAERVAGALRAIPSLPPEKVAASLPLPAPDPWKFARVLPDASFREMILFDYYRAGEVIRSLAGQEITILAAEEPDTAATEKAPVPGDAEYL